LLAAILEILEQFYGRLNGGEFRALKTMWDALSLTTGRQIIIATGEKVCEGIAESVDDDGTLIMRDLNAVSALRLRDVSLALRE